MFSLLTPIGLWLGALLAVPLIIHFLGRQRLRKVPFPSLMLLEERFAKSMQRHRLKNLLLLIIRTLLILCLLLALANPALRTQGSGPAPEGGVAAVLLHNGAAGLLPNPSASASPAGSNLAGGNPAGTSPGNALSAQKTRLKALDSAFGGRVRAVPLLDDAAGLSEASARHGDHGEAVERLLAALDVAAPSAHLFVPAYAWADLEPALDGLSRALTERPGLQLVLWDHGDAGARLSGFAGVRAIPSAQAPTVSLRALPNPLASEGGSPKVRAWLGSRLFQEAAIDGGPTEISLPLSEGTRTEGRLVLEAGGDFAVPDWHFSFPNPGRLVLAHAGSALASLPSLGRENYFRRIVHVAAAKDLPWKEPLRLVYLSNERNTDAAAYGRLVEFVKRGGRLIVGVGRDSDVPLLNRFLLQPLRMGRLGAAIGSVGGPTDGPADGSRATVEPEALAHLGGLPANPGPLGLVRKRFAFTPDSGTAILARLTGSVGDGGGPVLAERDFHQGKVLLWTTDLDDLEWSDLGVAPLVPLLHRAFQEGGGGLTANRAVASDSVLVLDLPEPGMRVEARDPEGRPFTRLRDEGGRLRLGPFDRTGIHTVRMGSDTVAFAVNLAPIGPVAWRTMEDWIAWNADRKAAVMKALGPFGRRVLVAPPEAAGTARAAVRPLWKAFFLAAILLLFLEGLVASAYSLGLSSRDSRAD